LGFPRLGRVPRGASRVWGGEYVPPQGLEGPLRGVRGSCTHTGVTEEGTHHGTRATWTPPGSDPGLRVHATQFQSFGGSKGGARRLLAQCWDWADRPVWFVSNRPPFQANTSTPPSPRMGLFFSTKVPPSLLPGPRGPARAGLSRGRWVRRSRGVLGRGAEESDPKPLGLGLVRER
jgi:hypothetical protein